VNGNTSFDGKKVFFGLLSDDKIAYIVVGVLSFYEYIFQGILDRFWWRLNFHFRWGLFYFLVH